MERDFVMNLLDPTAHSLAIGMPGPAEMVILLIIVVVVFGANRIPQLGEALGKGIRNFKRSFAKDEQEAEPTHREVKQIPESNQQTVDAQIEETEDAESS
jgi:sec-independent protein translocase protein TatA